MANKISSVNAEELLKKFSAMNDEINKIVNAEKIDDGDAVEEAKKLAEEASAYRRELYAAKDKETFKEILKNVRMPLPIAYKTIQILTNPALQFSNSLKQELSTITRVFFEIIICQCAIQNRSLYSREHISLFNDFKYMIKTLPEEEVLCKFELKCCRAALQNLDPVSARIAKVAKKNFLPMCSGIALTLLSANASLPFLNPSASLDRFVSIVKDAYRVLPEWWYYKVFSLKLHGLEMSLKSVDDYNLIKIKLKRCSKDKNSAFYICQVFNEVIHDKDAETPLKEQLLFKDEDLSIVRFSNFERKIKALNKFWAVRYLALKYLEKLVDENIAETKEARKAIVKAVIKCKSSPFERKIIKRKVELLFEKLRLLFYKELQELTLSEFSKQNNLNLVTKFDSLTREEVQEKKNEIERSITQLEDSESGPINNSYNSDDTSDDSDQDPEAELIEKQNEFAELEDYYYLKELKKIRESGVAHDNRIE